MVYLKVLVKVLICSTYIVVCLTMLYHQIYTYVDLWMTTLSGKSSKLMTEVQNCKPKNDVEECMVNVKS